jgi:hypothetical protein
MRHILLLLLLLLLLLSCSNKKKELEYLICKDSIQYWNVDRESNEDVEIYSFTYSFAKNGDVKKYGYRVDLNKRYPQSDCSPIDPNDCLKWSIKEDYIVYKMYNFKDKIIQISKNEDTIYAVSYYEGYKNNVRRVEKVKYTRVLGNLNIQRR